MKVVSFRMEESEIEDLLRDTHQFESSSAFRQAIQEWRELRKENAEKEERLKSFREESSGLKAKIEEMAVELSETKEYLTSSIEILTNEKNRMVELLSVSESENDRLKADLSSHVDSEKRARWKANEMRNYAVMFFSMFFVGAALSFILLVYLLAYHFDFRILVFAVFLSIFVMIVIGYFVKNYS